MNWVLGRISEGTVGQRNGWARNGWAKEWLGKSWSSEKKLGIPFLELPCAFDSGSQTNQTKVKFDNSHTRGQFNFELNIFLRSTKTHHSQLQEHCMIRIIEIRRAVTSTAKIIHYTF